LGFLNDFVQIKTRLGGKNNRGEPSLIDRGEAKTPGDTGREKRA
jgi:hypothetical protein